MAAHGYDRKHRKEFWSKFIQKEALKNNKQKVYGQDSYNYHTYL